MPRLLRYSLVQSLDGFIATEKGEYDWIPTEADIDIEAYLTKIDTFLMGRTTFEVTHSTSAGREFLAKRDVYMVSNTAQNDKYKSVNLIRDNDVENVVKELKKETDKKDIWLMGGGFLFRRLLRAGLVDRVEVAVAPVLLGKGIPVLPPPGLDDDIVTRLTLHSVESFEKSQMVLLKYDVNPASST